MGLKVFDFYSRDKVCVVKRGHFLMNNALFYILVGKDNKFKELMVQIPKRYHFINSFNIGEFTSNKKDEYDVLADFLKYNKELLKDKWGLSESEFLDLLEGLELVLLENYSKNSGITKFLLKISVYIKWFLRGLRV